MRVMLLSCLVAIGIAVVSYYILAGITIDTASSMSGAAVRL